MNCYVLDMKFIEIKQKRVPYLTDDGWVKHLLLSGGDEGQLMHPINAVIH